MISNGEAKFKELSSKNMLLREFENICLNVEQCAPEVELDLKHLNSETADKVTKMINGYKPQTGFERPVKMTIILKDDIPVYQQPRRIPV